MLRQAIKKLWSLFLLLLLFFVLLIILVAIVVLGEGAHRDGEDLEVGLVGVTEHDVLARAVLVDHVNERLDNGPHVVLLEVDLRSKLVGLVELGANDVVVERVANRLARHETDLHLVRASQNSLRSPLAHLARVVLEGGGEHRATGGVDFGAPAWRAAQLGVGLVESIHGHVREALLRGGLLHVRVQLSTRDERDLIGQGPLAVAVGKAGRDAALLLLVLVVEGVGVREGLLLLGDDLLRKVLVDRGRLNAHLVRGIARRDSQLLVVLLLAHVERLVDGEHFDTGLVALVNKHEAVVEHREVDIPGEDATRACHEVRDELIGGEHDLAGAGHLVGVLLDDRVVHTGGVAEHGLGEAVELDRVAA
mmetsp:Transcript_284/g.751  ORF Transcript_284/g.751 Transcript_284/m.751 type:complete len:364 (-) Transcript_284:511-1602(-)